MKATIKITTLGAMVCAAILLFAATAYAGPERINPKEPIVELNPNETSMALVTGEAFSWTGLYIGGNVGGNWSYYTVGRFEDVFDLQGLDNELDNATDTEFDPQTFAFLEDRGRRGLGTELSWIGGGQAGYQYQFGRFVVGVEGDYERTSTSAWRTFRSQRVIPQVPFNNEEADIDFTATRKVETNWTASARGRLGYAYGSLLIYATGGVACADVNVWAIDTARVTFVGFSGAMGEPTVSGTDRNMAGADDTHFGYTVGGGIEWTGNKMFSIGIEGRHSDFGCHTYKFSSNDTFESPGRTRFDLESDMVVVKFNVLLCNFFGGQ